MWMWICVVIYYGYGHLLDIPYTAPSSVYCTQYLPAGLYRCTKGKAAEKIKRETDVHLRQLAKKSCFKVRFWAFLGKGSSKTRGK
jgi:hypothetical protein